ncbi:MAG: PAS domain S-box protein [Melioribacteraceae bacterium]|nr:PAS domain S-box protein [Melioribacteraceae bacterium]MCF8355366.1 PAS domain S-box protein [Melioribacteraceae bacterium]MCF8395178.1 PAS domain S-box protein [Melioribacteraceae bacterium]MCF8420253.1 PAS domain S-box protein [Melioribacteraceae bacterium]
MKSYSNFNKKELISEIEILRKEIDNLKRKYEPEQDINNLDLVSFMNSAPFAIMIVDQGRVIYANHKLVEIFGYSFEDIGDDHNKWFTLAYPDANYREKVLKTFQEDINHLEYKSSTSREYFVTSKSGSKRLARFKLIKIDQSKTGIVVEDITELKLIEDQLHKREYLYRLLFNYAPIGILHYDENGIIQSCNDEFVRTIGSSKQALTGFDMLNRLTNMGVLQAVKDSLESGEGYYSGEYHSVTGDKISYTRCYFKAIRDAENKFIAGVGIINDITEIEKVTRELADSERQYRLLASNINDVLWLYDIYSDRFSYLSPSVEKIVGYKPGELIGRSFDILLPKNTQKYVRRIINSKLAKEKEGTLNDEPLRLELEHISKDGSIIWIEVIITIIRGESGKIDNLLGLSRDISSKKKIENDLRESEKKFRELVEMSPYMIAVHTDGILKYINEAGVKIMGAKSADELIGKKVTDFVHPDYKDFAISRVKKLVAGAHKVPESNEKLITVDGRSIDVAITGLRTIQDGKISIQLIVRDITEKIQSEKHFGLLADALRSINECISITDMENKILFVNNAFERTYGYTLDELIGENINIVSSEPEKDEKQMNVLPTTLSSGSWSGELINRRKDGTEFPIKLSSTVITDEENNRIALIGVAEDISERKKSEEKIHLQSAALEAASIGILITDTNGIVAWINPAFSELTGYKESEIIGESTSILKSGIHTKEFYENLWSTIKSGKVWSGEITNKKKDGSLYIEEMTITPVKNSSEEITNYICVKQDITHRKSVERELRESEERFRSLYENATIGMYRTTPSGTVLLANQAFARMLGYNTVEELYKTNLEETDYTKKGMRTIFKKILEEKGFVNGFETLWTINDGSIISTRESSRAIKDNEGKVLYYEGTVEDITEKYLADKKLEENEKRYHTLFELSPTGILLEDVNGIIMDLNPALCQSLKYSREELIGQHISILAAPENIRFVEENIAKINDGEILIHQTRSRRKDGTYCYMQMFEKRVPLPNGEYGIINVASDITEIKRYEEEIIQAKEKAEISDKLKSEFLAQMSHEIRSPINVVLSYSSLLSEEFRDEHDELKKEIFTGMENAGRRIIRTIDLILNMSEIQTGTYEPSPKKLNLYSDILNNLFTEFSKSAKRKGLEFLIQNKAPKCNIIADEYSVTQIFGNLIDNAIKYTKKGKIEVIINEEPEHLSVSVVDTGIGISEEYIPSLFEAFSQEEQGYTRKFEGNGLGLALVKKYCSINNAEINVESKKGRGAMFTVRFHKN